MRQELPEYLPSGVAILERMAELRRISRAPRGNPRDLAVTLSQALHAAAAAFPKGTVAGAQAEGKLIHVAGAADGQLGFLHEDLAEGMMALYRWAGAGGIPFRLGRVVRVVRESVRDPFVISESWWPVAKPEKYGDRLNLFGTWVPASQPPTQEPPKKRAAASGMRLMVPLGDFLVWPIELDKGSSGQPDGGRVPFVALHFLRTHCGIDVSHHTLSFAPRGQRFFMQLVKHVAGQLRAEQPGSL